MIRERGVLGAKEYYAPSFAYSRRDMIPKEQTPPLPPSPSSQHAYQRSGEDIMTVFLADVPRDDAALNRAAGATKACVRGDGGEEEMGGSKRMSPLHYYGRSNAFV